MQYSMDALETYFDRLPQFLKEHGKDVEKYVRIMVERIRQLQRKGLFLQWDLPGYDHAGFLGRYHDIGKSAIVDELWLSPAVFSDEERKLARLHTVLGAGMVKDKLCVRVEEQPGYGGCDGGMLSVPSWTLGWNRVSFSAERRGDPSICSDYCRCRCL